MDLDLAHTVMWAGIKKHALRERSGKGTRIRKRLISQYLDFLVGFVSQADLKLRLAGQ